MNRVAAGGARDREYRVSVQVGLGAAAGKQPRLVGPARVEARRVVGGVNGDRPQAQLSGGTENPHRDLSAIGDEERGQRGHRRRRRVALRLSAPAVRTAPMASGDAARAGAAGG